MNQLAKEGIEQFLRALSVDTKAPELEKTPTRVVELYEELFSGVGKNTKELWGELFSTDYNGLVAVTDIFISDRKWCRAGDASSDRI